jgi:hypothetical protein
MSSATPTPSPLAPAPLPTLRLRPQVSSGISALQLSSQIQAEIKTQVPNFAALFTGDPTAALFQGVIEVVCGFIQQAIPKGNSKSKSPVDKKQLAIVVLTALYNLSEAQQAQTGNIIDAMVSNKIVTKQKTSTLGKVLSVAKLLKNFL